MALLRALVATREGRRALAAGLVAGLGALGVGCALVGAWSREPAFSHALHVGDEGLACLTCHEDLAVSDEPGMPAPDTCLFCHQVIDEEKPPERRVERLFPDGVLAAAHVSRLADEVRFSHLAHVEAGIDCGACHEGIEQSTAPTRALAVGMDDCTSCHAEREIGGGCATCHSVVDAAWEPGTHAHSWTELHGRVVRARDSATENRCSLCHEEATCARCHAQEAPRNHDNHWRLRGHGLVARMDRQNCAACHEPASCNRCHAEVLPVSHTGTWGAPRDVHCLGCHFPLRAEGCAACHLTTPSHDLAPPKPSWHDPGFDCRSCHVPGGGLLRHVDDGTNCNLCHP